MINEIQYIIEGVYLDEAIASNTSQTGVLRVYHEDAGYTLYMQDECEEIGAD